VVFSLAAQVRELKTLEKAQTKELEKAQKEWRKLEGQTFNCQTDAEKALEQFNQKWKYHGRLPKRWRGCSIPGVAVQLRKIKNKWWV